VLLLNGSGHDGNGHLATPAGRTRWNLRSRQQVSGFFQGFDLVEPGVVQVPLWRPDHEPLPPRELAKVAIYGGVGRVR
jgi:S-adenosyl methyltransferase